MQSKPKRHRSTLLLAAVLCAALCLAGSALGADRTDHSFGTDGVAEVSPAEGNGPEALPSILDLANAPEGKMIAAIGGGFFDARYFAAARFDANGTLDRSFGVEGFTKQLVRPRPFESKAQAQAIAVQKDGRILVAGYREDEGNDLAPLLARYRPSGRLDPSFGGDGIVAPKPGAEGGPSGIGGAGSVLHDVAIEPGGRIIAVGAQDEFHGPYPADLVIAYTPNGRVDRRFGHHGRVLFRVRPRGFESTGLRSVKILPSGKILVAGYLRGRLFLARLTEAGKLDHRFGGGDGKVLLKINREPYGGHGCCQEDAALAVQRDGRILFAGETFSFSYQGPILGRFKPDGALDRSFGRHGFLPRRIAARVGILHDVAVQRDGRILVVGQGQRGFKIYLSALRLLPSGKVDRGFGGGGLASLQRGSQAAGFAALTRRNGRVVAAGAFAIDSQKERETELLLTRYLDGANRQ